MTRIVCSFAALNPSSSANKSLRAAELSRPSQTAQKVALLEDRQSDGLSAVGLPLARSKSLFHGTLKLSSFSDWRHDPVCTRPFFEAYLQYQLSEASVRGRTLLEASHRQICRARSPND